MRRSKKRRNKKNAFELKAKRVQVTVISFFPSSFKKNCFFAFAFLQPLSTSLSNVKMLMILSAFKASFSILPTFPITQYYFNEIFLLFCFLVSRLSSKSNFFLLSFVALGILRYYLNYIDSDSTQLRVKIP